MASLFASEQHFTADAFADMTTALVSLRAHERLLAVGQGRSVGVADCS
jgi:hypothetical protein